MNWKQLHKRHKRRAKILHAQKRISGEALGVILVGSGQLDEQFGAIHIPPRKSSMFGIYWSTEYIRSATQ